MIHPLFAAYELNPVSVNAQASVPVPEGLDLDAWIVPPPREVRTVEEDETGDRKGKKSKTGKGKAKAKDVNGKTKSGKKKQREEHDSVVLTPAEPEVETPEEKEERKRVSHLRSHVLLGH